MTSEIAPATDYWIEVGRADFLQMVKSLKLGKGQGTRFRVRVARGAVLDMTSAADIAAVSRRVSSLEPRL